MRRVEWSDAGISRRSSSSWIIDVARCRPGGLSWWRRCASGYALVSLMRDYAGWQIQIYLYYNIFD